MYQITAKVYKNAQAPTSIFMVRDKGVTLSELKNQLSKKTEYGNWQQAPEVTIKDFKCEKLKNE